MSDMDLVNNGFPAPGKGGRNKQENGKMKTWMKVCAMFAFALFLLGCATKAPYQPGVNSGLANPNSDLVTSDVLKTAIQKDATNIPEQFSQIQDSGLVHYLEQNSWARNPDGSIATIKIKDQEVPLKDDYKSMTKWASIHTIGGGFKKLTLKIGALFGADNATGPSDAVRDSRGGFELAVEDATGGIQRDPGSIVAKYEGQAKVQAEIEKSIGTTLDKHWAGLANFIKVRNDGRVAIIGAVGGQVKEIVGELSKFTVYGAVASGAQTIVAGVKELKQDGTVAETPTEVVVSQAQK